jgi:protein tyrosine phosphatase
MMIVDDNCVPEWNGGYVNASWLQSPFSSDLRYIATQGPMPNTVESVWRMIWLHGAETIVMLANILEQGKVCPSFFVLICP